MNALDQIDQIKSEARLNLIKKICQRKAPKVSFTSAMHKVSGKEDCAVNVAQSLDNLIDLNIQNDSDFFNQDFDSAFG